MAERAEPVATLATRIPKSLHRRLKVSCVEQDIPVMEFVTTAIEEKLRAVGGRRRRRQEAGIRAARISKPGDET